MADLATDKLKKLLARVTEDGGTGVKARVEGYEVAGKTGTAQKPVNGGYSSTAYTASFLGFLPVEDPEIAMVVVVDEPQPVHLGGAVAAPVFSKIANQAVRYLDIQPFKDNRTIARKNVVVSYKNAMPSRHLVVDNSGMVKRDGFQE